MLCHLKSHCKTLMKSIFKASRTFLSNLFAPPLPPPQKTLLILRTDAIGDFILFSPFIEQIRAYFSDYHISLIANIANKDLALGLHSKHIDSFIFISHKKFNRNLFYRIRFLSMLKRRRFTIVLNPLYSRSLLCKELISRINAQISFTPSGDSINMPLEFKNSDNAYYTKLTPCRDEVLFEYYRNSEFMRCVFESLRFLSDKKADFLPKARLDSALLPKMESFIDITKIDSNGFCVLFIGASASYRKWDINNFAKVALHLIEKYQQTIIICGGKEDIANGKRLLDLVRQDYTLTNKIIDFSGKTSLMQLATLVYNGNLVVSNETSAAHLAALLDTAIIAVYNGNHLGRFIPYPKRISDKYYPVFHPFITANPDKYKEISNKFAYKSELNINEIEASEVITIIDKIFKEKKCKK